MENIALCVPLTMGYFKVSSSPQSDRQVCLSTGGFRIPAGYYQHISGVFLYQLASGAGPCKHRAGMRKG